MTASSPAFVPLKKSRIGVVLLNDVAVFSSLLEPGKGLPDPSVTGLLKANEQHRNKIKILLTSIFTSLTRNCDVL
jgi:hypothetical protein